MTTAILSYVNYPNGEHYYDREFASLADLEAFVANEHPNATSYQIIVVPRRAEAA